jgi:hypothetical protein
VIHLIAILLFILLVAFGIYKRDSVTATLKMWPFSFSFEAKNNDRTDKEEKI